LRHQVADRDAVIARLWGAVLGDGEVPGAS
jgi:hypothetical protein